MSLAWRPMTEHVFPWSQRNLVVAAFAKDDPELIEVFRVRVGEHGALFDYEGSMLSLHEQGWVPFAWRIDDTPKPDEYWSPLWTDYLTEAGRNDKPKTVADVDAEWAREVGPIPTTTGAADQPAAGGGKAGPLTSKGSAHQPTGWQPTAANLALELANNPPAYDDTYLRWVESHAKRYLIVAREAERLRCARIAARIGNAGDPRAMATASAIMHEIENGE